MNLIVFDYVEGSYYSPLVSVDKNFSVVEILNNWDFLGDVLLSLKNLQCLIQLITLVSETYPVTIDKYFKEFMYVFDRYIIDRYDTHIIYEKVFDLFTIET